MVDPTLALYELLAHSLAKPIRDFEPGIDHLPPQLLDQTEQTGATPENAPWPCIEAMRLFILPTIVRYFFGGLAATDPDVRELDPKNRISAGTEPEAVTKDGLKENEAVILSVGRSGLNYLGSSTPDGFL